MSWEGRMNLFLLLLLGAIWGSSYLFIKVIVGEVPVMTLVAGRIALSAAILWIWVRLRGLHMPRSRSLWATYAFMGFFNGTLPYFLIAWGEQYIDSGLAALLQATMPIFTILMAHFIIQEERLTPMGALGIALGFAGVLILMLPELRQGLHGNVLGQLAIIGASVSYASTAIVARQNLRGQSPLLSTTGQLTMGTLFTLPIMFVVDWPFTFSPSVVAVASWLALSILGTVIAYVLYYMLIERTSATFTSMVTYIIPINGLILGAVVLGEPVTLVILVSLALILTGVLLVRQ